MSRSPWIRAVVATAVFGVLASLLCAFAAGRFTWGPAEVPKAQCEALDPATLTPVLKTAQTVAYQARVAGAVIREPQNTWSNLAFVLVGSLIWTVDRRFFSRLLAAALVALGLASGLYHASLIPAWRTVDVATMCWVSFALCGVGFEAVSGARSTCAPAKTAAIWFGVVGSMAAIAIGIFRNDVRLAGIKPFDSTYTTVAGVAGVFILAVVGLVRAARARTASSYHLSRIATLAALVGVAAFLQINDRPGRLCCAPEAALQAHAVWHVLMAVAALLGYDLFRMLAGQSSLFAQTYDSSASHRDP